jgi:hypothetical protein
MPRILEHLDAVFDEFFGLKAIGKKGPYYPKKTACNQLSEESSPMADADGCERSHRQPIGKGFFHGSAG